MKVKVCITAALITGALFGAAMLPKTASATRLTTSKRFFQDNCVVVGDNEIPLRVRATPNGKAIGSLKVGTQILAYKAVKDRDGNYWTKIRFRKGFGYVWTGFVSCG